jgi:NADH-quinone oxidoreductase subunit J
LNSILFLIIAALGLLMALGTVLSRNLVHAALHLVGFFFLVACLFVLLEAEFLAAMQVLVYIGAVAILIMFGIMLTRNIQGDETTRSSWRVLVPAAAISIGVLAVLVVGIARHAGSSSRPSWLDQRVRPPSAAPSPDQPLPARARVINHMGKAIGDEMMTRYVVPFELAGLLLTAAVVGAVALATRDGDTESPPDAGQVSGARSEDLPDGPTSDGDADSNAATDPHVSTASMTP